MTPETPAAPTSGAASPSQDRGAREVLPRLSYDEGEKSGWTLTAEYLTELQKAAESWGGIVILEACETIALAVERRILAALEPASAPAAGVEEAVDGEISYQEYRKAHSAEFADEPADLESTLRMLEEWAPDALPANKDGQVPFARALMDAAADSLRKHLAALPTPIPEPVAPAPVNAAEAVAWQYRYMGSAGLTEWAVAETEEFARAVAGNEGECRPLFAAPPESQAEIERLRSENEAAYELIGMSRLELRGRATAAEQRVKALEEALSNIAHSFTEDSHGNIKTLPAGDYQAIARTALRGEQDRVDGEGGR